MSRRAWLIIGLICGAVVVGTLGGILLSESRADAPGEWGKALLTLFVAILVSGLLTLILSEYSRAQQEREANREQAFRWLRWLVEANNRLRGASALLRAREGVAITTYGAQISNFIKAVVTLRSLQEDLPPGQGHAKRAVDAMLKYLGRLGEEYAANYSRLAWAERVHEEFLKRQLSQPDLPKEPVDDPADPWLVLHGGHFPVLVDLLEQGKDYQKNYRDHYECAREAFRKRLADFGGESKARGDSWRTEDDQLIPNAASS